MSDAVKPLAGKNISKPSPKPLFNSTLEPVGGIISEFSSIELANSLALYKELQLLHLARSVAILISIGSIV